MRKKETVEAPSTAIEATPKKRATRARKKVEAPASEKKEETPTPESAPQPEATVPSAPLHQPAPAVDEQSAPAEKPARPAKLREFPTNLVVRDFCDLVNQGGRIPMLGDQQIQQLTYEDAIQRSEILEGILRSVLDYDIVLSDTNIWLELQVGHSSSHSDPRVNARLMFERQLESISKMMKRIGGRFMIMSETYEEVDRFASALEPVNYKDADWSDEALCRNVAARLAKRLMLAQQKENRLRIEGICSESHHGAFADPAIIRRTVELFAEGRKVLLLTNDASVGIRSLGMCDDLQRINKIDDPTWRTVYEPQRPMVLTMDDLKVLDTYTRQYHFLLMAAGRSWMQDVAMRQGVTLEQPLQLWLEGFRPGDKHERRSDRLEQQRREQQRRDQQRQEQERREAEKKAEQERQEQERAEGQRREQERREQQRKADRERAVKRREEAQKQDTTKQDIAAGQGDTKQQAAKQQPEASSAAASPAGSTVQPAPAEQAASQAQAEATASANEAPVAAASSAEATQQSEEKPKTRRGGRGRRSNKAKTA